MGITTISKNLIKTSVLIDKYGRKINKGTFNSKAEEMKAKQEERARKLGLRRL